MDIFGRLFSKRDPDEELLQWGIGFADEAERVYRNHVTPAPVSPLGLLKARLLASAFTYCAFASIARDKQQEQQFRTRSCQAAAYGLLKPGASPTISTAEVQRVSVPFIVQAANHILHDCQLPEADEESAGFRALQTLYEDCVRDSVGDRPHTEPTQIDFTIISQQIVGHSFKCMWQKIVDLKTRSR